MTDAFGAMFRGGYAGFFSIIETGPFVRFLFSFSRASCEYLFVWQMDVKGKHLHTGKDDPVAVVSSCC